MNKYEYLHYWFCDSNVEVEGIFSRGKQEAIADDLRNDMIRRKEKMVAKGDNIEEGKALIDLLTNRGSIDRRKEIFDNGDSESDIDFSGIKGPYYSGLTDKNGKELTYGQLAKKSGAEIQDLINNLTDGISVFVNKLKEWIELAYNSVCKGSSFEQYKEWVIRDYIVSRKIHDGIDQDIISLFLAKDGLAKLELTSSATGNKASYGPFDTALRNLLIVANEIPTAINSGSSYDAYSTRRLIGKGISGYNLLPIISGKISGMFSNVKGTGAELAVKITEEKVIEEVAKENELALQTKVIGMGPTTVIRNKYLDPGLEGAIKQGAEYNGSSKEDVHVTVNNGKVTIDYGISVKNYTFPASDNAMGQVSLVSDTPLIMAARRIGISDFNLMHLAAAHGNDDEKADEEAKGILSNKKNAKNITVAALNQGWKDILSNIIYSNFLNIIAGEALSESSNDNVWLLVVNGKAFTIEEILNWLDPNTKEKGMMSLSLKNKDIANRTNYTNLNKWIKSDLFKNDNEPQDRSEKSWSKVYGKLKDTKMHVDLNILAKLVR